MDIQLIHYFVKIVQCGSFTKAGESLKIPKSTLSKAVAKLERETGTKLLIRSTRKQTLTAAGREFYQACMGPMQTIEDAQKALYGQDDLISGTIKITVPEDFEIFLLSSCIQALGEQYPELKFIIKSTNDVVDLVGEGFDFAVRIGPLEESNLKVRTIGHIKLVTVAARNYLEKVTLETPEDLSRVRCIGLTSAKPYQLWSMTKDGQTRVLKTPMAVETNQITSVYKLTCAGAGVAILPTFLCQKGIDSGELVRVLPDWHYTDVPVSLISPLSTLSSVRLKVISDEIIGALRQSLT
ncbi:LysR family transcriptional regulator [Thalassomonas viridans]|uniref:LysR family transcriptional regulator n=1 Tax=Thalassomonas viridans TaxID=137584 RepID=A0AAF0CA52_9GAMM|nr:LysR family transcriptional regulator [Thalassomonas viridans]WDE06151.1 LysR family transcriptional regulator [Thalassomonas viridans]